MRTIERSSPFKRDYKREAKEPTRAVLEKQLSAVLTALATDQPLAKKYRDHALVGEWMGYRECHPKMLV